MIASTRSKNESAQSQLDESDAIEDRTGKKVRPERSNLLLDLAESLQPYFWIFSRMNLRAVIGYTFTSVRQWSLGIG